MGSASTWLCASNISPPSCGLSVVGVKDQRTVASFFGPIEGAEIAVRRGDIVPCGRFVWHHCGHPAIEDLRQRVVVDPERQEAGRLQLRGLPARQRRCLPQHAPGRALLTGLVRCVGRRTWAADKARADAQAARNAAMAEADASVTRAHHLDDA